MASMARAPFRLGPAPSPCLRSRAIVYPTPPSRLQGTRGGVSQTRRLSANTVPSQDIRTACPTKRREPFALLLLHPRSARTPSASRPSALLAQSVSQRSYSSSSSPASATDGPSSSTAAQQSVRPEPPDHLNEKEREIFDRLNQALEPVALQVEDISGGCGSMYAVAITADRFKGLPVIKQHRLVNEVLGEEIKNWHGIQLRTKAP